MSPDVDLVLHGGRIRTLDPERPAATAIAISAGRVVAVGSDDEITALGSAAERIDLAGAAAVPGLTDSHLHPFMGAINARGADLLDAHTIDDVFRLLSAEASRCAPDEWVLGWGLDYNVFESTGIKSDVVEEAVGGRPAALTFMDFHTMLTTRRGLALAGIDGPREFVEHAEIVVDAGGAPTGELRERGAMDLLDAAMPPLTDEATYGLIAAQLRKLAAVGITGVHGMDGTPESLAMCARLEANGDLVTRLRMPMLIAPDATESDWERLADAAVDARGRRWSSRVAKFFIDGVIDSGTGWLYEPDEMGDGRFPFWPEPEKYRRAVAYFAGRGFQCVTHATGDRGVREALDAYEAAGAADGVRHRIEHIETLQPQDLPRFAALGVVASMQTQHMMWLSPDRSDNWSRRLGDDRCDRAFPTRDLLESGARLALGSDWPVARYDPREGIASAQLRRPPGVTDRGPYDDQAIDGLTALEGYTTGAAWVAGQEAELGRLAPGFLGDVTVMAEDPATADPDALVSVPVLLTVVDGEVVHRDGI